jgi:hypothetical protein
MNGNEIAAFQTSAQAAANAAQLADMAQKGTVLVDQTFNAAWVNSAPSVSTVDGTITLNAHGLTNGTPIEFDANGGTLPGGISQYNVDLLGGVYYSVINATTNTFQICATIGGSTVIIPTTAGSGWRVRTAGVTAVTVSGLDLNAYKEYDIFLFWGCAKKNVTGDSLYLKLNNSNTFAAAKTTTWMGTAALMVSATFTKKYSLSLLKVNLQKKNTLLFANMSDAGQDSDDKSVATIQTVANTNTIIIDTGVNITSLFFAPNSNNVLIRNGTRAIAIRR